MEDILRCSTHGEQCSDVASGRLEARIEWPGYRLVYHADWLAFMPDGERIVASHSDTTVLFWIWKQSRRRRDSRPE
jgi:hypothetical protein